MNKLSYLLTGVALAFYLFSCESSDEFAFSKASKDSTKLKNGSVVNLLWNQRLIYKSYIHRNITEGTTEKAIREGSDLSQAHLVGNPANVEPGFYPCSDGDSISANNYSAPSVTWVSLGFDNDYFKQYPGFDMWCMGSGYGDPLEYMFANNATGLEDSVLREVGFIYEHWPVNPGKWSFKDEFTVGEFENIIPYFDAKLVDFKGPAWSVWPAVYLTADFRFSYRDNLGNAVRTDLVGVIFSNPTGFDGNGDSSDAIYWQGWEGTNYEIIGGVPMARIMLHADRLNINYMHNVTSSYINFSLDYVPLIQQYLPAPPAGYTYNDAIITGFDVYSSNRGADISFYVKNIELYGIK